MPQGQPKFPAPRVALVTEGLMLGGSTTFLCNLGGELIARNIAVEVFSFEAENPLAADFSRARIPMLCQDKRHDIFEDRLVRTLRELRRFNPTVVVSTLGATSFEVLRYLPPGVFRMGVVQSHDPGMYQTVRPYAGHLDAIAAVSKTIQETLESMPEFARVAVRYLPYGVPMPESAAAADPSPPAKLQILYLGRIDQEQKRVRLFPQILEQLKSSGIPFHWTVAGEGPERRFLESAMATTLPGQTVSFPGKVAYADVPKMLSAHNIFLLASDYEGLPLSLLEAMGYGLVPVVSDLPSGIRDVVDGSTGKRVAPEHIRGYAEAILELHHDRQEMTRLSRNCQAKVRREFSVGAMVERWLRVWPERPPNQIHWPESWRITAPLASAQQLRFSRPARLIRRCLVKLRR
jgi:glycosyltransferase involved in cell wall biosynthesis